MKQGSCTDDVCPLTTCLQKLFVFLYTPHQKDGIYEKEIKPSSVTGNQSNVEMLLQKQKTLLFVLRI